VDEIRDHFRDLTSHETYAASLASAGLAESALGHEWIEAAESALLEPMTVDLPYREDGFLPPNQAGALGFRFHLERGQRLSVDLEVIAPDPARMFVDLYRAHPDGEGAPLFVMPADSATNGLGYTVGRRGDFILRVQPELLRGGEYRLTLRSAASLAFPVEGASTGQIQSFFGADRDGGRRSHHGVDIFMPRGTPVVAGTTARVSRVQVTRIGGKVIWLRDREQNQSLYYAHLDSQIVREGAIVRPGEVLGLIGNTGNARTTAPHLHFGIYRRGEGPVNPMPFLRQPPSVLPDITADTANIDTWLRVSVEGARVRTTPDTRSPVLREVARNTAVQVEAVAGGFYRVQFPDGERGFLSARVTESTADPFRSAVRGHEVALLASPTAGAPVVERTAAGSELPVIGTFGEYLFVRGSAGTHGWLRQDSRSTDGAGGS
jgi:murein DD-endopeptidase MepM/ murein hydrolase activator NlpD